MPRRQETGVPKTRRLTTSWCFELRDGFLGLQCLGICVEVTFRAGILQKERSLRHTTERVGVTGGTEASETEDQDCGGVKPDCTASGAAGLAGARVGSGFLAFSGVVPAFGESGVPAEIPLSRS